ncbi:uncharacterized protein ACNS7B_023040 [Menidia menidia]
MSTSDAAQPELSVVGGPTATPSCGVTRLTRTAAARVHQNETFGSDGGVTAPPEQGPSFSRVVRTHKELKLTSGGLRTDEEPRCALSDVPIQSSAGPNFTSSLVLRLSKPETRLKRNLGPWSSQHHSLTEPLLCDSKDRAYQVNGRTASPATCNVTSTSETSLFPAKRDQEVFKVANYELEDTRDFNKSQIISNSYLGPRERDALNIPLCCTQGSFTGSLTETGDRQIKDSTKRDSFAHSGEVSDPSTDMLSSTVVTVLAPHWNGRLRRSKRFDGVNFQEAQGNRQDVGSTSANSHPGFQSQQNQHSMESVTDGSHFPRTVPSLSTRRNTVGWSAKSDPSSLDFESKRELIQTVSLDVGAMSPSATTPSTRSLLFLNQNEERRNLHAGHQDSLSSKPTTSSLLLSLRRSKSNTSSVMHEGNPSHVSCSLNHPNGKGFTTQLSPTNLNNNVQERVKPFLSPSSLSYRTAESGSVLSTTYTHNPKERNISDSRFFSTSPTNRDAENNFYSQQPPTINRLQTSLTSSKQAFQNTGPPKREQNNGGSERPVSETFTSVSRQSPYGNSNLLNAHSLPRRTTLTSTSWWKQVSQECNSPITFNETDNIKDRPKTAIVTPFNHNSDMTPKNLTANKRLVSQIPANRDTAQPVCKGNVNLGLKLQSRESERLFKQDCGSNSNYSKPQRPHSTSDVLSGSKISRATAQKTVTNTKDPSKHNINNTSFKANVNEFPHTSLNPRSTNPSRDNCSKSKSIDCPPRASPTPSSNNTDSQTFAKPSLSLDFPSTLSSQCPTSQTISGLPPTPNTKNTFQCHSISSQGSTRTSSFVTSKCTNKSNTTPLGFERSYPSIPKPFNAKTVNNIIPTVNSFSKTNPISTSFTTSSPTTAPSPSLLGLPASSASVSLTSVTAPSLLTPPLTPVITSPNTDTSSPKGGSKFSNSPEREPKKPIQGLQGKKARRVTWGDTVDVQCVEPVPVERQDQPQVQTNPVSLSKRPQSFPSIFSFLRSGSPGRGMSPTGPPNLRDGSTHVGKGGKYRSMSSDSADLAAREREKNKQRAGNTMTSDQERLPSNTTRQERTLSVESGVAECRYSAPLSLPPDFSSSYKVRYSSTPYSALVSKRQALGEPNKMTHRLPSFSKPSELNNAPQPSPKDSFVAVTTPPLSYVTPPVSLSLPFQKKAATQRSSEFGFSNTSDLNNNHSKQNSQDCPNSQIELLDNRVHISSQSLAGDEANSFSSTYVTETLVYSIKPKADVASPAPRNTTPRTLQLTANPPVSVATKSSQQSLTVQRGEAGSQLSCHSDQSSNDSRSGESRSRDYESINRSMKEGKSRFYSVEGNNEQSSKRSRFGLKKSESAPNSVSSRSDSERVSKSYNRMDQVLHKLRRKFSSRRSDDDVAFPWKWRRVSQTPSLSESSDISSVSDNSADSAKTMEDRAQDKRLVLGNNKLETDFTNGWTQDTPAQLPVGDTAVGYRLSVWPEKSPQEAACEEQKHAENIPDGKLHLSVHVPAKGQSESYENSPISTYSTQYRKSTPSPRSPFSPFSLSPLSPFCSTDVTDDSVFYSPKMQRRRESSSPCEPREGFSLGSSRRSRASIGPPSASPGQDNEQLAASYADLKYGIEPGRSFSVSSVLSSRCSRPGRISTGSRFMSVGDLSQSTLSCGGNGSDWDQGSLAPDCSYQPANGRRMLAADPGKMRSRSLPRSLTRCLTNWSSGLSPSQPATAPTSKPARLRSPNVSMCHFAWDAVGPPTPPPTPPLSPVSRRMSKPPSLSSPTFPSSSRSLQQVDTQPPRARLLSREYVSSLSTFDESSDSSSDTTTDDEYYIGADEDGERETEL